MISTKLSVAGGACVQANGGDKSSP